MLEEFVEDRVVPPESIGEEEPKTQEDQDEPERGAMEFGPIHTRTIRSPPQNE